MLNSASHSKESKCLSERDSGHSVVLPTVGCSPARALSKRLGTSQSQKKEPHVTQFCGLPFTLVMYIVYIYILQEVGGGCEDWMELAQDRDRWRALVSTAMNLRVPKIREIS